MCFYCNCELVVDTPNGEILRDDNRVYYNIRMGNVDYTLAKPHFTRFIQFVDSLTEDNIIDMTNRWSNRIILRQENMMGGYSFDQTEFVEFRTLLREAHEFLEFEKEVEGLLRRN